MILQRLVMPLIVHDMQTWVPIPSDEVSLHNDKADRVAIRLAVFSIR